MLRLKSLPVLFPPDELRHRPCLRVDRGDVTAQRHSLVVNDDMWIAGPLRFCGSGDGPICQAKTHAMKVTVNGLMPCRVISGFFLLLRTHLASCAFRYMVTEPKRLFIKAVQTPSWLSTTFLGGAAVFAPPLPSIRYYWQ